MSVNACLGWDEDACLYLWGVWVSCMCVCVCGLSVLLCVCVCVYVCMCVWRVRGVCSVCVRAHVHAHICA